MAEPTPLTAVEQQLLQDLFVEHGGTFHGPRVEHAHIEVRAFYRFLAAVVAPLRGRLDGLRAILFPPGPVEEIGEFGQVQARGDAADALQDLIEDFEVADVLRGLPEMRRIRRQLLEAREALGQVRPADPRPHPFGKGACQAPD